jgi:hypothetical protein
MMTRSFIVSNVLRNCLQGAPDVEEYERRKKYGEIFMVKKCVMIVYLSIEDFATYVENGIWKAK